MEQAALGVFEFCVHNDAAARSAFTARVT